MLKLDSISARYGNIYALKGVSLTVNEGEIVTIIGANGAGKSTTLNTISGIVRAVSGSIFFNGKDISSLPTEKIVESGLIQVPEGREIFPQLTVYDNLMLGAYLRKDKDNIKKDLDYVVSLFPRLAERFSQLGGTLSGGEQQMLAIGRALMSKPKLLLMDEPSLGLSPIFVQNIFKVIKEINKAGTSVLLVEQNAHMALSIAKRAYVMETGKIIMEDETSYLLNNDKVKAAYLGF